MTAAPRHQPDDQADAAAAVRAYQAAKQADLAHAAACTSCQRVLCPAGEALRWKRERAYREAKVAVKVLGFGSVEAYLGPSDS